MAEEGGQVDAHADAVKDSGPIKCQEAVSGYENLPKSGQACQGNIWQLVNVAKTQALT